MTTPLNDDGAYDALRSKDARFDGVFFAGITSTGIYCRPVCPARTPKRANCRFFPHAAAAEAAGFRPCLRCRPELAPGSAPVDRAQRIAHLLVARIHEGALEEEVGLEETARHLGLSSRQLRRVVRQELGVTPMGLIQTRRLLLAKQLLTETSLPVIDIAFASGFGSLRRFNDAFLSRYRMPPTRLRREGVPQGAAGASTLRLGYRPPFAWEALLAFLAARSMKGVEVVAGGEYARTVALGGQVGWIRVGHEPRKHCLRVTFSHSLAPVLPALLGRLRQLFDLAARPDLVAEHLARDERLRPSVEAYPGLRVPGAFEGFEMAVRAILGQQITVKAATTLAGRFAEAFGERVEVPVAGLTHLTPRPEVVAAAGGDAVASLGIVSARARALGELARAWVAGGLRLEPGLPPEEVRARLVALPGVGEWTAGYIAMRALRWPDAFPTGDVAVLKALGRVSAREAEELSRGWAPWRAYAVLHLWKMAENQGGKKTAALEETPKAAVERDEKKLPGSTSSF